MFPVTAFKLYTFSIPSSEDPDHWGQHPILGSRQDPSELANRRTKLGSR